MGLDEIKGADSELRFISACSVRTPETPAWFVKVIAGGPAWDIRGVDAFAYYVPEDGSKRVKVPIQIKSSLQGKRNFRKKASADSRKNVIVIAVLASETDDQLRGQLYAELERVRGAGKRFDDFLTRTMAIRFRRKKKIDLYRMVRRSQAYKAKTE
jgi:hypothetical protein